MKETLAQLESQISITDPNDPTFNELVTLKNEIEELIALSEPQEETDEQLQAFYIGQKCSFSKFTRFGLFVPMNAVISEIAANGEVRVFYVTPTSICESPCQRFLSEGSCFLDLHCPFSHGAIVQAQYIDDWYEPPIESYFVDNKLCFAATKQKVHLKSSSVNIDETQWVKLWHPARIRHFDATRQTVVVEWMKKRTSSISDLDSTVSNLPISDVFPLPHAEDEQVSDDSSRSDLSLNISDYSEFDDDDEVDLEPKSEPQGEEVWNMITINGH